MTDIDGMSVLIVNWRNEERTLRCIAAVQDWDTIKPEIFVVDNESTAASSKALAGALGSTELIRSETNLGYGGGNNLGIARAMRGAAPFILLLNSDAEIGEQDAIRLLDSLKRHPDIAILGPILQERHRGAVQSYAGGRDIVRNALTRQPAMQPEALRRTPGYPLVDVDYVPGAVLLVRRSLFEHIGLLDEAFFFSGEIADFCARARAAGYRVCVDLEAEARHHTDDAADTVRSTLYVYYNLRNRLLYAKKHHRSERAKYFALWSKLCLTELGKALALGRIGKARAIVLAMAHASTNRFGNRNAAFL